MLILSSRVLLVVLVAAMAFGSGCEGDVPGSEVPSRTEILWDTWGVPHIYAPTTDSLFFAHGWAQMEAHGDLILKLYGEARGQAAEYWGADYLASDRRVRTLGLPERGAAWVDAQDAPYRSYVEAFVDGMNAYANAHPDRINDERARALPVQSADVFAHVLRAVHITFLAEGELRGARQWERRGSNAWAIGPARSASGHAMLIANPHLPWDDLFTWFEVQMTSAQVDAYGAAFVGTPFPGIAFNDHLGWTHTVNPMDGADRYRLRLIDGGYAWDGGTRAFETRTDVLRVRQSDGSMQTDTLTVRESVHGPVIAQSGEEALALRVAGLDETALVEQYWQMLQASSFDAFDAAHRMQQMPMFNTVYADRDGHILYHFGGQIPVRSRGGWADWQGIVPGDTSATLWTETHAYDDLPRVVDPPSGWVQNANDPPFTATFPRTVDTIAVPGYMTPVRPSGVSMFRPQRSIEMISSDSSITFDELLAYKNDTRMTAADRLLDDLIPSVRETGSEQANRAADVLEAWDRTADATSEGGVLFTTWMRAMVGNGPLFQHAYSFDAPRDTPDGIANPELAVQTLDQVAGRIEGTYDSLTVPWGAVHRLVGPDTSYAASGGNGAFGIFRVLWYRGAENGRRRAVGGDSYIALTEFTEDGPRARVLMPYGNASQPGSPYRGDQLNLYADKEMRPVWRTRPEIMKHLDDRTTFD